jgi:hypothetical protein
MLVLYDQGLKLKQIAARFELSTQRVSQIIGRSRRVALPPTWLWLPSQQVVPDHRKTTPPIVPFDLS